jgi:hypothetical protein
MYASILYDVVTVSVRHAFLNLHGLLAYKAGQQIHQRAFIVVQMKSFSHVFPIVPERGTFASSVCAFRLRSIDADLLKFLRAPGESSPALGALLMRRGGVADLVDRVGSEFLSAQPPM